MGMKFIFTESQLARLEDKVGELDMNEMRVTLACSYMDYHSLVNFLNGRDEKKLGNNTLVHMIGGADGPRKQVAVKYHNTDIVTINAEDIVTLNTNGWETSTTKERLNQFLSCRGAYIYQKKHVWYIKNEYETIEYKDGMQILPDGQFYVQGRVDPRRLSAHIEKIKSLDIDPKYKELYGLSDDEETN